MATAADLIRLPRAVLATAGGIAAFPVAVLVELRRLNASLTDIRATLGPHLEHLPNLEALEGIRHSLDRLSEPGAALDRLADVSETLDRLAELDTSLAQLGKLDRSLSEIAAVAQAVAQLATVTEHLPALVAATTTLPELPERAEAVEHLVERAVGNLDLLQPALEQLATQVSDLQTNIDRLGGALGPIGRLADRVPGSARRR